MNNNWVVGGIDRYLNPIENKQKKSEPDKTDYPEFRIKTQHVVLHTLNHLNICYCRPKRIMRQPWGVTIRTSWKSR
jgi:hypothetical protein